MLRDARVIIPVGIAPADDFVFKPPSYGVMPAHAASPRGWDKWGWASGPPGPHSPPSGWARMPSRGMVLSQVSLPTYSTLNKGPGVPRALLEMYVKGRARNQVHEISLQQKNLYLLKRGKLA